jgi:uncharacterized membrane protein YvbJ
MRICRDCGEENPDRASFCRACAAPFRAGSEFSRETRRTVTIGWHCCL